MSEYDCKCKSHTGGSMHVLGEERFLPIEEKADFFKVYLTNVAQFCSHDKSNDLDVFTNLREIFEKYWNADLMPEESRLTCLKQAILIFIKFNDFENYEKYFGIWLSLSMNDEENGKLRSTDFLNDIHDIAYGLSEQNQTQLMLENKILHTIFDKLKEKQTDVKESIEILKIIGFIWTRIKMPQKALKLFRRALKLVKGSNIARSFSIESEIMFYISLLHDKLENFEMAGKVRTKILERGFINDEDKYIACRCNFMLWCEHLNNQKNDLALLNFCIFCSEIQENPHLNHHLDLMKFMSLFGHKHIVDELTKADESIQKLIQIFNENGVSVSEFTSTWSKAALNDEYSYQVRYWFITASIYLHMKLYNGIGNTMQHYNIWLNLLNTRMKVLKEMKRTDYLIRDLQQGYQHLNGFRKLDTWKSFVFKQEFTELIQRIINLYDGNFMYEELYTFMTELQCSDFYNEIKTDMILFHLARLSAQMQDFSKAFGFLKQQMETEMLAKFLSEMYLYFDGANAKKAFQNMEKSLKHGGHRETQAFKLEFIALCYLKEGDSDRALTYLKRCIKDEPYFKYASIWIATIAMTKKNYRLTLETFNNLFEPRLDFLRIGISLQRIRNVCDNFGISSKLGLTEKSNLFLDLMSKKSNWNLLSYSSQKDVKTSWRHFKNSLLRKMTYS